MRTPRITALTGKLSAFAMAAVLLLAAATPVSAQIRSARARVLQTPSGMSTTRKANFQIGDILGTPLVAITINNGTGDSFLRMKLKVEFGGDWAGDWFQTYIIRKINSGASLTFNNTDLLNYVGDIRWNDTTMSSTLEAHTGVNSIETFGNLRNIPEGNYTIILSCSEVTLADPANPTTSRITNERVLISENDASARVDFKVVTIGSIGGFTLPTIASKNLTFQLPEIPVYNDARGTSTSSTKIVVNGPGYTNLTLTKSHARSVAGSSALKGHPSDTTNGYVTYDLSDLRFRAGQSYSIDIGYYDWNGLVITERSVTVNFPAPRMTASATLVAPFQYLYRWAWTGADYSPWVKEYRLYLNGAYKGYSSTDSIQPTDPLAPGTTYNWYVMPINLDGTPFYSSSEIGGISRTFTTAIHNQLDVRISSPQSGILFKGQEYTFRGTATPYDGATINSSLTGWRIGGASLNGLEVRYTPTTRYPTSSPLPAWITATDSLGLTRQTSSVNFVVADPQLELPGGATRQVPVGSSLYMYAYSTDIAGMNWYLNGSVVGSGYNRSYSFSQSGTYKVMVEGYSAADVLGRTKTIRSQEVTVQAIGAAPLVTPIQPNWQNLNSASIRLGTSVTFAVSVQNQNRLSGVKWTIAGPDESQNGVTGTSFDFKPLAVGQYTLTATATDEFQLKGAYTMRVNVTDPVVTVTSPAEGQTVPFNTNIYPSFTAPGAMRYFLLVNNSQSSSNSLYFTRPADIQLRVVGVYNFIAQGGYIAETQVASGIVNFRARDLVPPRVAITFPREGDVMIAGATYQFSATPTPGSNNITNGYWEIDGQRVPSSYTMPTGSARRLTATYHAINSSGVEGTASVNFRTINPSATIQIAGSPPYRFTAGTFLPLSLTVIDANGQWTLNNSMVSSVPVNLQPGQYLIGYQWNASVIDPTTRQSRTYSGNANPIPVTVYSASAPVITALTPAGLTLREATGTMRSMQVNVAWNNPGQSVQWYRSDKTAPIGSGTSILLRADTPGDFILSAVATDIAGMSSRLDYALKIFTPSIAIDAPVNNASYAASAFPVPVVRSADISGYQLFLDGASIGTGANYNWAAIPQGNHTLRATGTYVTTSSSTPQTVSSALVAFRVANAIPPSFAVQNVRDGDRIIAGKQYTFTAAATNPAQASATQLTWMRSGSTSTASGTSYTFTPAATDREITFTVRGLLNGLTADKTFKVNVIDPYLGITIPERPYFPAGQPIPLQSEFRAIDRIEWTVDGQAFSGTAATLTSGQHTVAAKGFAANVRLPSMALGDYEYSGTGRLSASLKVATPPSVSRLTVTPALMSLGGAASAAIAIAGDATLVDEITLFIDGTQHSTGESTTRTGLSPAAGSHTVRAVLTATDGRVSTAEASLVVHSPVQIAMTRPAANAIFAPDADVAAEVSVGVGEATSIAWSLDGAQKAAGPARSYVFGRLPPGTHRIEAVASNPAGTTSTASVTVTVPQDLALELATPSSDTEILIGTELACLARIDRVGGADIDLADAAQNVSWYVDGRDTGIKGLSYRLSAAEPGEKTVQARYAKGPVAKSSSERKVRVRDIAAPTIVQPANGAAIRYIAGRGVPLQATGEPGATFSWFMDNALIATGADTTFLPSGAVGQKQIRLVTTARGRTAERMATVTLSSNTPPTLNLVAPAVQYTGDNLAWSFSTYDVDQPTSNPPVQAAMDGVALAAGTPRVLTPNDVGIHTISAIATDSAGEAVTREVEIRVEHSAMNIQILSPIPDRAYSPTENLTLVAAVAAPGGGTVPAGVVRWRVQFLDSPSIPPSENRGATWTFRPAATGDVAITATYLDSSGRARGVARINVQIAAVSAAFAITWPQGRVVNPGASLTAGLVGLPAGTTAQNVTWTLDGLPVPQIASLAAPETTGAHLLVATLATAGATARAELAFEVNGRPTLRIDSPATGAQIPLTSMLILSGTVEDDQPDYGEITWRASNGVGLGSGNPLAKRLQDVLPTGAFQITATASDPFGSQGTATIPITIYSPFVLANVTANGGRADYFIADGSPLTAAANFAGGVSVQATWTLRQGSTSARETGAQASFDATELAAFSEGPATLALEMVDSGLNDPAVRVPLLREFALNLTRNAAVEKVRPAQGEPSYLGEPVPVALSLPGFTSPSMALTVDGQSVDVTWAAAGSGIQAGQIPASAFTREGVYQVIATATEGSLSRSASFSLNLYQRRSGVFVDSPPAQYDLLTPVGSVTAVVQGLTGVDAIQWTTDLSATPVATGATLNLAAARLTAGTRTITVEARAGSRTLSTFSFPLRVLGLMQLQVTPAAATITARKGAAVTLEARARDRDGTAITGTSIRWVSHVAGLLGTGEQLALANLRNLGIGEHIVTVTATGPSGQATTAMKTLRITAPPGSGGSGGGGGGGGDGQGGGFDDGSPIEQGSRGGPLGNQSLLARFGLGL